MTSRAIADITALGDTTVVAAQTGWGIRVTSMVLLARAANQLKWQSNTTAITGTEAYAANGGVVLPPNHDGWFVTAPGEALTINATVADLVGVTINYTYVR